MRQLTLSRDLTALRYPPRGQRTIMYRRAKAELFAENAHAEGTTLRLTLYKVRLVAWVCPAGGVPKPGGEGVRARAYSSVSYIDRWYVLWLRAFWDSCLWGFVPVTSGRPHECFLFFGGGGLDGTRITALDTHTVGLDSGGCALQIRRLCGRAYTRCVGCPRPLAPAYAPFLTCADQPCNTSPLPPPLVSSGNKRDMLAAALRSWFVAPPLRTWGLAV